MTSPVGGIDPHQDTFTVGVVDHHGVEITHETFDNTAAGYGAAVDLLEVHGVWRVGVEGSAKWGAHVAIALTAAGFDTREVQASRSAAQRRSRRLDKTDAVDAVAAARALLAEPTLWPVQTLEVYDPLVAQIEAVLEHRRALVAARTLLLHHAGDQIAKLPTEIRDASQRHRQDRGLAAPPRTRRPRHRHDARWCIPPRRLHGFIDKDRTARREIRRLVGRIGELLDEHGTTLRDEPGIGPIAAATLLCEVGNPPPLRPGVQIRPLERHRRRRAVIRRRHRRRRQAPPRLQRQPPCQQRAPHRLSHPGPTTTRRGRLPRPQSHRRQDQTRSPTSPQTPPRQPRPAPAPSLWPRPQPTTPQSTQP